MLHLIYGNTNEQLCFYYIQKLLNQETEFRKQVGMQALSLC